MSYSNFTPRTNLHLGPAIQHSPDSGISRLIGTLSQPEFRVGTVLLASDLESREVGVETVVNN
jgi:hypothetical protein